MERRSIQSAAASTQARETHYRARGWWPGEALPARYRQFVDTDPDGLAVADDRGGSYTHRALWERAEALAEQFRAIGLQPRDVALIFMPNTADWQLSMLALLKVGAVPANLPVRTDVDTLAFVMSMCDARLVLTARRDGERGTSALATQAGVKLAEAPAVAMLDEGKLADASPLPGRKDVPSYPLRPDIDHLMFTSSTTGRPKAVMHTADTLAALNITFTERFGLGPQCPIFMPSPLGHSIGAIHGARLALHCGAPLVVQDRWDAGAALQAIAHHRCGFTAAATPFLKDLVEAPWRADEPKLAPLKWFLCGGAQVPPALMAAAASEFPNSAVTVLWGMTEGGLTTSVADSPADKVAETAGLPLPGLEVSVLSASGEALGTDEEGELAMRGPGVFVGYHTQPDLYAASLTADGFFRTGDLACIDADGYVRITGRLKDLIIRGGVNLSPVPIEDALSAHPLVREAVVVGYPDERLGERICAVVIPSTEVPPTLADLTAYVGEAGLPRALWPELIRCVDVLPRTPAGKVRKIELRDQIVRDEDA